MSFPYIVQGNNITVVIKNTPHTLSKGHVSFEKVKEAIKNDDWATVESIIEPKKVVLNFGQGHVSVQGSKLFWKNMELDNSITRKIIEMITEGFSVQPLIAFMENLMTNPSKRATDELYRFLEKGNLPITPDGYFLAYKKVKEDYMDVHSNTVLNKPASLMTPEDLQKIAAPMGNKKEVKVEVINGVTVVSTERNNVDDNFRNQCSEGLHFCSKDYLNHFSGSHVMILKINPRDVVSIPDDYNSSKGRTCRYEIVGEVGVNDTGAAFTSPVQENASNNLV